MPDLSAMSNQLISRAPSYLRVVVTTRCNYQCSFCHMEGDPQQGSRAELPTPELLACLRVMAQAGMRKIKLLGGEPLMRRDLSEVIVGLREAAPSADLSMITAGAIPTRRLTEAFDAGLDRINLSIHGFTPEAFRARNPNLNAFERRARFITALLATGRPVKLNYVYTGPDDLDDLSALLRWAAPRPVVVNVLDDLGQPGSWCTVAEALWSIRGLPSSTRFEPDPDSLATRRWVWADGLEVELKHQQLGQLAPYSACATCPARARCREGIFALRLTHQGALNPCMDRPDLGLSLVGLIRDHGEAGALALTRDYLRQLTTPTPMESAQ